MEEWMEQAEGLIASRIRSLEKELAKDREEKVPDVEERCREVNRILFTLPDADREWLDAILVDKTVFSNEEKEAYYRAGIKDGIRMFLWLLKET